MLLSFEPWPGTLGPVDRPPDRRPGSIRRTTSIRSTWPEGVDGHLLLTAHGRDLVTRADRRAMVSDGTGFQVVAQEPGKTVRSARYLGPDPVGPGGPDLRPVEGLNLLGGFRKGVATRLHLPSGSLLALLLDDLPAAALVSGSGRLRVTIERAGDLPGFSTVDMPVVCIGRRRDGAMARSRREGRPLIGQGPPAGDLGRPDDPLAWPEDEPLPRHAMRRVRRIDVARAGDLIVIDTHFRDSFMESSGIETSVHEYELEVTAGVDDQTIRAVTVRPRVLPGPDCPGAAASAQAVVGRPLDQLRQFVRAEMNGDTICTHLNDQLRSLADVPALLSALPPGPA